MRGGRGGKMRIVIFGSSGMVGQGALRECLRDREVGQVLSVVRAPTGTTHGKLREIVHKNFLDFTAIEKQLAGLDGCLYLGRASKVCGAYGHAYGQIGARLTNPLA